MAKIIGVRSDYLRPISEVFVFNLTRTATFAFMPAQLAFAIRKTALFAANATIAATGKPIDYQSFLDSDPPERFFEYFNAERVRFNQLSADDKAKLELLWGPLCIVELIQNSEYVPMHQSMDSLFASIINESWTAFETLAVDIWVELVNRGPAEFSQKVLKSRHLRKKEEDIEHPLTFDPRKDFARSLLETRRVVMQTLPSIEKFFSAFIEKAIIKRIFHETSAGYIKALSAVRNIISHKAGIADAAFIDQVKTFPELNAIKEKKPVLLDGVIVSRLRFAAIEQGLALLTVADDILSPKSTA